MSVMSGAAIVAVTERGDGSILIVDANGTEHVAKGAAQAWVLLKQIMSDPTLPRMEQRSIEDDVDVDEVMIGFVQSQIHPSLAPLARPAYAQLRQFISSAIGRKR